MCSYVDVQYDTEEFETFRESKDTREQAVELFPNVRNMVVSVLAVNYQKHNMNTHWRD